MPALFRQTLFITLQSLYLFIYVQETGCFDTRYIQLFNFKTISFFQVEKELTATNSRQIEKNKENLAFKKSFYKTLSSSPSRTHVICFKSTDIFYFRSWYD